MQHQLQEAYQLQTREETLDFLRQVLGSPYPVAIWRLPQTSTLHALIDLTTDEQNRNGEIESLNKSFIINGYCDTHPTNPLVLNGDILLKIEKNEVQIKTCPTLSSKKLEAFQETLNQSSNTFTKSLDYHSNPDYQDIVSKAVQEIKAGELHKVVLSRFEDFDLNEDFDAINTLQVLANTYQNAFCHLTNTQTYGCWMGASPEKLIAIQSGKYFSTDALAGTQVLPPDTDLMDVAWTQKEIEEQAMVSRYIIDCFKKIRLREFDEIGPRTVKAGNLSHLKTAFRVDMDLTNSPMLGSTMLELLHPTSAVCGMPRELADEFIKANEGYQRSLYAGFLGPVGFEGNTDLFVNLRCMQIDNEKARLFAGAGITEYSNPEKEFQETSSKMQTMLKVLKA